MLGFSRILKNPACACACVHVLVYGGYTLGESSLLVPVYPVSPADETHYRAMGETLTLCAKIKHKQSWYFF